MAQAFTRGHVKQSLAQAIPLEAVSGLQFDRSCVTLLGSFEASDIFLRPPKVLLLDIFVTRLAFDRSLRLSLRIVTVHLNLPLDILELGFNLLFRLDASHKHHVVVSIHLDELVIHSVQGEALILLAHIRSHIFLKELHFGGRDARLYRGVIGHHQRTVLIDNYVVFDFKF